MKSKSKFTRSEAVLAGKVSESWMLSGDTNQKTFYYFHSQCQNCLQVKTSIEFYKEY